MQLYPSVVLAWIWLLGLPRFLYHRQIVEAIGGLIGKVVKLDFHTDNRSRGRFVRLAIFLNLDKPLISQVLIDGIAQRVEYEALPTVCFGRGKYGHVKDFSPKENANRNPISQSEVVKDVSVKAAGGNAEEARPEFGPWMPVERKSQRNLRNGRGNARSNKGEIKGENHQKEPLASRFLALIGEDENSDTYDMPVRNLLSVGDYDFNDARKGSLNARIGVNSLGDLDSSVGPSNIPTKPSKVKATDGPKGNDALKNVSLRLTPDLAHKSSSDPELSKEADAVENWAKLGQLSGGPTKEPNSHIILGQNALDKRPMHDNNFTQILRKEIKNLEFNSNSNSNFNNAGKGSSDKSTCGNFGEGVPVSREKFGGKDLIGAMVKKRPMLCVVVGVGSKLQEIIEYPWSNLWRKWLNLYLVLTFVRILILDRKGEPWLRMGTMPPDSNSPNKQKCSDLWDILKSSIPLGNVPWVAIGDFNVILLPSEKLGGMSTGRHCPLFGDFVDKAKLHDLGFRGPPFTWHRGLLFERLDMALGNEAWVQAFPNSLVTHLPKIKFDHRSFLLLLNPKFVEDNWDFSGDISNSLSMFTRELKDWNKTIYDRSNRLAQVELKIRQELETVLRHEELLWKQKARFDWLNLGDRNTKFFHTRTTRQRKNNRITMIRNDCGEWIYDTEVIEAEANKFLQNLYGEPPGPMGCLPPSKFPSLGQDDISFLERHVSNEEIKVALFDMAPLKAPGSDGFHALFFQKQWNTVGDEVCNWVKSIFNGAPSTLS
ncbi:hypothetical protein V6Z11_A04G051900 [Gossypium hirsutum]